MSDQYYISQVDEMKNSNLDLAVSVARALGHPARLRTVAMLRPGELCVCQITEVLGLAPSTVSAHLKELRRAGLTVEHKEGKWVWYGLSDDAVARAWINAALGPLDGDPQMSADSLKVRELRSLPVEDLCRYGYDTAKARMAQPEGVS
jgi:arsenate reductase/ArsR family transcriptional regulator